MSFNGQDIDLFRKSHELPSPELDLRVRHLIISKLKPSFGRVLLKLLAIHFFVGTTSLLFCPQLGVSPLNNLGIMVLFSKFGERICMFFCGLFFLGTSGLAAVILLRIEEVKALRRWELVHLPIAGALSFMAFYFFGAEVAFPIALFWWLGTVVGGLGTVEIGWQLRRLKLN